MNQKSCAKMQKSDGLKVGKKFVKEWLTTEDTLTQFKSIVRRQKFQKAFVTDLAEQVHIGFVDLGKYGGKNEDTIGLLLLPNF